MTLLEQNPVMPLADTRLEIDATAAALRRLDASWDAHISALTLNVSELRRVILVGSGDSLTAAQCAAAWLQKHTTLPCQARQTFEFLQQDLTAYGQEVLIVALSASGRPSPVLDALHYALGSKAQVLGITNAPGTQFSHATPNMLFTGAKKRGIPTQSSSCTLYALLRLGGMLSGKRLSGLHLDSQLEARCQQQQLAWQNNDRTAWQADSITLLGSGLSWGLALSGSNLLSCGPQRQACALQIEEFHHSLRLNQAHAGQLYILIPGTPAEFEFYHATQTKLLAQGATTEWVNFQPDIDDANNQLLVMQWLYEMSWHTGCDFVAAGGQRISHMEA